MQTTEKPTKRPFHETIVDAIYHIDSSVDFAVLAPLIKATKIPKGHDEIIAAWNDRSNLLGHAGKDLFGVVADLRKQKQEATAKETAKTEAK